MISRKLAGAGAAGVGAATAVAALLLGTVSGSAVDEPTASAFGISAEGLVDIDPTPEVSAPPDEQDELVELPSPVEVGVLRVEAAGNTSSATAVDLDIEDLLQAEIIEATCDNGVGDVSILGGDLGGTELPSDPGVNEELDLSPIARVVFNRQTDDNGRLTVEGVRISVLPGDQLTDLEITPGNLDQLRILAPDLNVPSMEQLQTEQTQTEQTQAEQAPVEQAPAEQAPAEEAPAEPAAPTLEDLFAQLVELNPGLEVPIQEGDALLEVVISSATCGAAEAEREAPPEAPRPKPVETQLPVTH